MYGATTHRILGAAQDSDSKLIAACIFAVRSIAAADGLIEPREKQVLVDRFGRKLSLDTDGRALLEQLMEEGAASDYDADKDIDVVVELVDGLGSAPNALIFSLACEMAAADDDVDSTELALISEYGSILGVSQTDQAVLRHVFASQPLGIQLTDSSYERLVQSLSPLAYCHYSRAVQDLAAGLARTLHSHKRQSQPEHTQTPPSSSQKAPREDTSKLYESLEYSELRRELDGVLHKVVQLPDSIFSKTQRSALEQLQNKSGDATFRIAVVGAFSSGKSTFLNALVRQSEVDLFPSSPVPCTANVNILRYGEERRLFKMVGGTEHLIDEAEFKALIELPEHIQSASEFMSGETDALIVEAPVALCKQGVQLVDSPGLNEHPKRTEITERFLRRSDAVILLMNANQLLTQDERSLIEQLTKSIKRENIFFAVNFFDQVEEPAREKVRSRALSYLKEVYKGKDEVLQDRLHFISAKHAIKDHQAGKASEWVDALVGLETAVGSYIAKASGAVRWRRMANETMEILANTYDRAHSMCEIDFNELDEEIARNKQAQAEIQRSQEEVARTKAVARSTIESQYEAVVDDLSAALAELYDEFPGYLEQHAEHWHSDASPIWGKSEVIEDYKAQLTRDMKSILEWWTNEVATPIIASHFQHLLEQLNRQFVDVQRQFNRLEHLMDPDYELQEVEQDTAFVTFMKGAGGFVSGGPMGALVGATMEPADIAVNFAASFAAGFTLVALGLGGPVSLALGAAVVGMAQLFLGKDGLMQRLRDKILSTGIESIDEVTDRLAQQVDASLSEQFGSLANEVEYVLDAQMAAITEQQAQQERVLEKAKRDRQDAERELEERRALVDRVMVLGGELEKIGTVAFSTVLKQQGFDGGATHKQEPQWKDEELDVQPNRSNYSLYVVVALIIVLVAGVAFFFSR